MPANGNIMIVMLVTKLPVKAPIFPVAPVMDCAKSPRTVTMPSKKRSTLAIEVTIELK